MLAPAIQANQRPIVERFKAFYRDLSKLKLDDIETVYTPNIQFRDPATRIRGIEGLYTYLDNSCKPLLDGRFEYLDELVTQERAYIKWKLHFRHPRLGAKPIIVRGISHIHFNDLIHFHEDVYDLGALLYDHVPVLGRATHWLKARLTRAQD